MKSYKEPAVIVRIAIAAPAVVCGLVVADNNSDTNIEKRCFPH